MRNKVDEFIFEVTKEINSLIEKQLQKKFFGKFIFQKPSFKQKKYSLGGEIKALSTRCLVLSVTEVLEVEKHFVCLHRF